MPRRFFPLVLILCVTGFVPLSTPTIYAQSCEQELARQDAALRQFEAETRRDGLAFVLDDGRRAALDEVSKRLKGDPTADAAREINARWAEYQAYVDQGRTFQTVASDLSRCLRDGSAGCLAQIKESVRRHTEASRLAARIGEAVQKWIDSLGNDAISRAAERVDRARNILENFTSRAASTANQSAMQGIDRCLRDFDQRVQQAQNRPAVDTRQPPRPGGGQTPPKKGMSGGKLAALVGIPAAAAVGLGMYAKGTIDQATGTAGDGGSSSSSQIRLVNQPTMQCTAVGGASLQSLCLSDIVLDVGNVFTAGSQVCIRLDASGFPDCQIKGTSSQMAFRIQERTINCPALQMGIFVYNGNPTGTQATARVSANIPVTCR